MANKEFVNLLCPSLGHKHPQAQQVASKQQNMECLIEEQVLWQKTPIHCPLVEEFALKFKCF